MKIPDCPFLFLSLLPRRQQVVLKQSAAAESPYQKQLDVHRLGKKPEELHHKFRTLYPPKREYKFYTQ
jgi:hypothetical protein